MMSNFLGSYWNKNAFLLDNIVVNGLTQKFVCKNNSSDFQCFDLERDFFSSIYFAGMDLIANFAPSFDMRLN